MTTEKFKSLGEFIQSHGNEVMVGQNGIYTI